MNQAPPSNSVTLAAGSTLQGVAGTASAITYTISGVERVPGQDEEYRILAQGQLSDANATLYTGRARTSTFLTLIQLVNTTTSAVSGVILSLDGSGASTRILPGITIPAKGTASFADGKWSTQDSSGNVFVALSDTVAVDATPLAASIAGVSTVASRSDHAHHTPGGIASIVAASAAIVNAEAVVATATLPANLMAAGTTFRITAAGQITTLTSPGNHVFKIRIGTTTLTGNIAATLTCAAVASITAQPFFLQFLVTVRTAGASGTVVGQGVAQSTHVTTGAFTALNVVGITTSAVAVDTTAVKLIELTAITGASDASVTFQNAAIEVVKL
jgi:hypothetical protein